MVVLLVMTTTQTLPHPAAPAVTRFRTFSDNEVSLLRRALRRALLNADVCVPSEAIESLLHELRCESFARDESAQ